MFWKMLWSIFLALVPKLLEMAAKAADEQIDGANLSEDQINGIQCISIINSTFGYRYAQMTDKTEIDDEVVKKVDWLCLDTAEEGNFKLPEFTTSETVNNNSDEKMF